MAHVAVWSPCYEFVVFVHCPGDGVSASGDYAPEKHEISCCSEDCAE